MVGLLGKPLLQCSFSTDASESSVSLCHTISEHFRMWRNREAHIHTCRQKYRCNFFLVMFYLCGTISTTVIILKIRNENLFSDWEYLFRHYLQFWPILIHVLDTHLLRAEDLSLQIHGENARRKTRSGDLISGLPCWP